MSLKFLKSNRTRYWKLLDKEMIQGKCLINDITEEDDNLKHIKEEMTAVNSCMRGLTYFSEKLYTSIKELSIANETLEDKSEIDRWIEEDSDYMTRVVICTNILTGLENKLKQREQTLENAKPKEASLEESLSAMCRLQSEMQQLLKTQQYQIKNLIDQQCHQQRHIELLTINRQQTVKLPKLEINCFCGDKLKFKEFWDCFETTVDKNPTLSNVEKFNYLVSKLDGDAKNTIAGLAISNDNYNVAVNMLNERYGDIQTVVNAHYVEIINITAATNTTAGLRNMFNTLENI